MCVSVPSGGLKKNYPLLELHIFFPAATVTTMCMIKPSKTWNKTTFWGVPKWRLSPDLYEQLHKFEGINTVILFTFPVNPLKKAYF